MGGGGVGEGWEQNRSVGARMCDLGDQVRCKLPAYMCSVVGFGFGGQSLCVLSV